jgi:phage terminase large subunit GpA-like protein
MDMPTPQHQIPWDQYAIPGARAIHDAYLRHVVIRPYRSIYQFAEQEIILPDGPYQGQRFRSSRQPAHGAFFNAVDSGSYFRYACTGPQQSGKTLAFVVIPILYHLFERQQTVLFGLPTMEMANDKWKMDIRPAIEASRYAQYLPRKGAGSGGGTPELIQFANGANLKFITAGGGDEKRAGFTGPVLVVTEVSHLDEVGGKSDEATKLKQMEGRVRAYRASGQARIYLESTVTIEQGRIWQEWSQGTAGEVVFQCNSCREWIAPSREHLIGWQEAETESQAEAAARWACPECGLVFDDATRLTALQQCKLRHRGQSIDEHGNTTGDIPPTKTMGFRYTASTNTFASAAIVAADEWRGKREVNQDLADRELLQWTWALPAAPKEQAVEPLDWQVVMHRQSQYRRGLVPSGTRRITAGVDVRAAQLDWFVIAEQANGQPICIDYGFEPVQRDLTDLKTALRQAVRLVQDKYDAGWEREDGGPNRPADIVLIDSGWETDTIRDAVASHASWNTAKGFGHKQHLGAAYRAPRDRSKVTIKLGEGWHDLLFLHGAKHYREYHNDADHWKRRVHQALSAEATSSAALLLPFTEKSERRIEVAKQLTAEREVTEFEVGKGTIRKWAQTFTRNHLLDAAYLAFVGLSILRYDEQLAEIARQRQAEQKAANGPISGKKPEKFVRKLR